MKKKMYLTKGPKQNWDFWWDIEVDLEEFQSRRARCAVGGVPEGESVVVVELPWLISQRRSPVFLQSGYITHADCKAFPSLASLSIHFVRPRFVSASLV